MVEFGDAVDIDDGTTVDSEVEGRKKSQLNPSHWQWLAEADWWRFWAAGAVKRLLTDK